jgi:polysaccharide transporter, PST family
LTAGLPFGLIGVATAYAIVMFGLFVPTLVYAGRPVGIGVKDVLSVVGPQTVSGLGAVAFGLMLQHVFLADFSQVTRFSISAVICLVTYLALVVGVFRVTGPLQLALSVLRDFGSMRSRGNS